MSTAPIPDPVLEPPAATEAVPDTGADDLDGLTEAERVALADTDDPAETPEPEPADAEPAAALPPEPEAETSAEPPVEAEADDAAPSDAEPPDPEPASARDTSPPEPASPRPDPEAEAAEAAQTKIAELEQELDTIDGRFDDGELTAVERRQEERRISREIDRHKEAIADWKLSQRLHQSDAAKSWEDGVRSWFAAHPEFDTSNTIRLQAFDQIVRQVEAERPGIGPDAALDLAWERYGEAFGVTAAPDQEASPSAEPDRTPEPPPASRPKPPTTLATVPAAAISETGDRFAELAALFETDPLAAEDRFALLSDADREAFLRR